MCMDVEVAHAHEIWMDAILWLVTLNIKTWPVIVLNVLFCFNLNDLLKGCKWGTCASESKHYVTCGDFKGVEECLFLQHIDVCEVINVENLHTFMHEEWEVEVNLGLIKNDSTQKKSL